MNNSENEIKGYLFESFGYKSDKDLRNLIEGLTKEQAIIFINKSLEYCHSKGLFSMFETELISKSLSLINSDIFGKNDTD